MNDKKTCAITGSNGYVGGGFKDHLNARGAGNFGTDAGTKARRARDPVSTR